MLIHPQKLYLYIIATKVNKSYKNIINTCLLHDLILSTFRLSTFYIDLSMLYSDWLQLGVCSLSPSEADLTQSGWFHLSLRRLDPHICP